MILYQATFAIPEIDFVPGPFCCQISFIAKVHRPTEQILLGYFSQVRNPPPPKDLKVHSEPPVTHHGLHWQHQRKVKNTQIYEFYHFPENGRMQCGLRRAENPLVAGSSTLILLFFPRLAGLFSCSPGHSCNPFGQVRSMG